MSEFININKLFLPKALIQELSDLQLHIYSILILNIPKLYKFHTPYISDPS